MLTTIFTEISILAHEFAFWIWNEASVQQVLLILFLPRILKSSIVCCDILIDILVRLLTKAYDDTKLMLSKLFKFQKRAESK